MNSDEEKDWTPTEKELSSLIDAFKTTKQDPGYTEPVVVATREEAENDDWLEGQACSLENDDGQCEACE